MTDPLAILANPARHLSHGFYLVSEREARDIARPNGKRFTGRPSHGFAWRYRLLPIGGTERLCGPFGPDAVSVWLARSPHNGRMVWTIRQS